MRQNDHRRPQLPRPSRRRARKPQRSRLRHRRERGTIARTSRHAAVDVEERHQRQSQIGRSTPSTSSRTVHISSGVWTPIRGRCVRPADDAKCCRSNAIERGQALSDSGGQMCRPTWTMKGSRVRRPTSSFRRRRVTLSGAAPPLSRWQHEQRCRHIWTDKNEVVVDHDESASRGARASAKSVRPSSKKHPTNAECRAG